MVDRLPRVLLRAEGLAAAVAATVFYFNAHYPWWLLVLLVLAPDLSMVGYLGGRISEPRLTTLLTPIHFLSFLPRSV